MACSTPLAAPRRYWLRAQWLGIWLLSLPALGWSQVRFPAQPQSVAECEQAAEAGRNLARQHQQQGEALSRQRDSRHPTASCFSDPRCSSNYYRQGEEFNRQIGEQWRLRDQIYREVDIGLRSCTYAARAVERQREEQQRLALDRQRELERQQREAQRDAQERQREASERQREAQQRQADMLRQQREHQATMNQRLADAGAAMSEQLRRLQQADLERANRASGLGSRNEPRVIATLPPQDHAPDQRNSPRVIYTPEQREAARQEAEQAQREQQRRQDEQTGAILRGLAEQAWASARGGKAALRPGASLDDKDVERALGDGADARSRILDAAFNPDGRRFAEVDERVRRADQANREINARRGISPLAGQMAADAYSGTGAAQNRTLGLFERTLSQLDGMAPTSPWPAAPPAATTAPARSITPPPPPAARPAEPAPPEPKTVAECLAMAGAEQEACLSKVCPGRAGLGQPRCVRFRAN